MSQRTWQGGATAVAQVWAGTVTDTTSTHTYILTLTDENGGTGNVTYTVQGGDTTSTIATNVAALVNGSTDPRFQAILASTSTGTVILTARTPGVPFYVAASGTGTWSNTGNTTASSGPYDWNTRANWVENVLPVNADNVTLDGSYAICYGLVTGLALGSFSALGSYSGAVGKQGQYLQFTCTSFYWAGTGKAFVNIGSSAIAPRIIQSASANYPASGIYLLGTAMTTLSLEGGSLDFAGTGQASTATTIQMVNNTAAPRIKVGSGATVTNLDMDTGTAEIGCALSTLTADGGTLTTIGSGTVGTMTNNGCDIVSNSGGTITTLNANGGTTDFSQSQVSRTVTTMNIQKGATVVYDPAVVTVTSKPVPVSNAGPVTVSIA